MAKRKLNEKDVDQLLAHYRAERRRLGFQLELVRRTILDLKKDKAARTEQLEASETTTAVVKRGPGRPRKAAGAPAKEKAAKRGPGRPPKRVRQPRELNDWDGAVIEAITTNERLMPKEELLKHVTTWAKASQPRMKVADIEAHLTRTLQKLSGRKKMLGTYHSGLRRGYHYGLQEWFFKSSGKLRRQHLDKLVLTEE